MPVWCDHSTKRWWAMAPNNMSVPPGSDLAEVQLHTRSYNFDTKRWLYMRTYIGQCSWCFLWKLSLERCLATSDKKLMDRRIWAIATINNTPLKVRSTFLSLTRAQQLEIRAHNWDCDIMVNFLTLRHKTPISSMLFKNRTMHCFPPRVTATN